MKFGIYLPNYGDALHPRFLVEVAQAAEEAGWDGLHLWDHILVSKNQGHYMVDPWVALAAMATVTERIRLGTTVTPLARRRPWKLARETVTLDHLSGGRLTLAVGLGAPDKAEFTYFGEDSDRRLRGQKLDEGLEVLIGLWSGKPFAYNGKHYQLDKIRFQPPTHQQPRIPIWVGGYSSNEAPFRRAARFDGAFPLKAGGEITPSDLLRIKAIIDQHRSAEGHFDLVNMGTLSDQPGSQRAKTLADLEKSGLTWWLENLYPLKDDPKALLSAIQQGPPAESA